MTDNKKNISRADRERINLSEEYEVRDWAEKFNITLKDLRSAVEEVGPLVKDVEAFLKKR